MWEVLKAVHNYEYMITRGVHSSKKFKNCSLCANELEHLRELLWGG